MYRTEATPAHNPSDSCPFCGLVAGKDTDWNRQDDIVLRDAATTAFVSPKWWESNPGHVIVIPDDHFENLYEIPDETLGLVYASAKRVAAAMRQVYECEGTSTRQHNEAGGGQDVWHFHVHVFPRHANDGLYENNARTRFAPPSERQQYARKLRDRLSPTGDRGSPQ